jgi:hypothetical protein
VQAVAVAVVVKPTLQILEALVVVVAVAMLPMWQLRVLQTQVLAVVGAAVTPIKTAVLVVRASSSSGMPTHLMTLLLQQALHPSATLADTKSIHGLVLVQSHSEVTHGTLCTT